MKNKKNLVERYLTRIGMFEEFQAEYMRSLKREFPEWTIAKRLNSFRAFLKRNGNRKSAISSAFYWEDSTEGQHYWSMINIKYYNL